MKMYIKSVMVEDQAKALAFYTETLDFVVKHNIPMGEHSWLTLVSKEEPDGVELALEPNAYPPAKDLQAKLKSDNIPWTSFSVDNMDDEIKRLKSKGVTVTQEPTDVGTAIIATIDDTCGNLIQLIELKG
jgi:predicted enzyme related to lactoylglutathione lyase